MNSGEISPGPATDNFHQRALSAAALAAFVISVFIPFLITGDAGILGAVAGYVLALTGSLLSLKQRLSRIVLAGLVLVALLASYSYLQFRRLSAETLLKEQRKAAEFNSRR